MNGVTYVWNTKASIFTERNDYISQYQGDHAIYKKWDYLDVQVGFTRSRSFHMNYIERYQVKIINCEISYDFIYWSK